MRLLAWHARGKLVGFERAGGTARHIYWVKIWYVHVHTSTLVTAASASRPRVFKAGDQHSRRRVAVASGMLTTSFRISVEAFLSMSSDASLSPLAAEAAASRAKPSWYLLMGTTDEHIELIALRAVAVSLSLLLL